MGLRKLGKIMCVGLALSASSAQAEVLPVSGVQPAISDAAITIETIALDDFEGTQGSALRFELKADLQNAEIDGQPWFNLVEASDPAVQAIMSGTIGHDSVREDIDDKEVKSCLEKDDNGKCLRNRTTFVPCSKLTVRLYPDLLLRDAGGEELWNFNSRRSKSSEFCEDESSRPTTSAMLDSLHSSLAYQIRRQLAPVERSREVRILERRKGFEKPDRNTFKDAVKMTKHDALAACIAFEGLEANNPSQPSLLFNIGVCKEGAGELDLANDYYSRTQAILGEKSYITDAFKRVERFQNGERQLAQRANAMVTDPAPVDEPAS